MLDSMQPALYSDGLALTDSSQQSNNSTRRQHMTKTHVDLFTEAGFRPRKPLAANSRERLFSQLGCPIPADLSSLYEMCDGARSKKAECRVLPLAEAVELIVAYDFIESFKFLPFFESENAISDPVMFVLDGPLRGYIYHHRHDGTKRVLAANISQFARAFGKLGSNRVDLENTVFDYPRKLSEREKKVVQKIRDEVGDSDSLLDDLATSRSTEKKTGWAAQMIAENKEFEQFLIRCEMIFKKAGIAVVRDDHYGLLVGPKKKGFAWLSLQQRQKRKDFEKFIVNFIRPRLE